MPAGSVTVQVWPPSVVLMIRKCIPSGGSETARPTLRLKNVMQS